MRKLFHFALAASLLITAAQPAAAQQPSLAKKKTLATTLSGAKQFTGSGPQTETISATVPDAKSYTLEVKAKVTNASGRGLDIQAVNADNLGFRFSMSTSALTQTADPDNGVACTKTDNTSEQTIRVAVTGGKAHLYQNGYYVSTTPLSTINMASSAGPSTINLVKDAIPASWATKPAPTDKGWYMCNGGSKTDWVANARFEQSTASSNTLTTSKGSTYTGSFFFVRWDGEGYKNSYYVLPVTLEANSTYTFTMGTAYHSNYSASQGGAETGKGIRVSLASDEGINTVLASQWFGASVRSDQMADGSFTFSTTTAGTYYLALRGGWGLFAIANLNLVKIKTLTLASPGFLFGNNENGTSATIDIASVTYEAGTAYAPGDSTVTLSPVTVNNAGTTTVDEYDGRAVTVGGKTDLHIIGDSNPLAVGSTVDLKGENAWLFFDNVKPSQVIDKLLKQVTIDGKPVVYNKANKDNNNVRVAIYDNGAVVIPYGEAATKAAITVYDGENYTGNSRTFDINTFHNNLGEWDNKIRSFKLRRGFMATLANNADGTGFSKVFIADDADLNMPALPEGMEKFVSFVRAFKWEWVSKKGKAGDPGSGSSNRLNVTAYYNWNFNGTTTDPDKEYSLIFQKPGWPTVDNINGINNVTHVLGYNEPDNKVEANVSQDYVVRMWPNMMKSGLRVGSPAPTSVWNWNEAFIKTIDSLNYRVDFMVAHIYEANLNASSLKSRIDHLSSIGDNRPVWITEWNNGANWTNEAWPTESGPQRDANCNIIAGGSTVTRPLSPENAEKQRAFMAACLPALDKMNNLERYYEYDWVQDARALELNGQLTPAGKVYAEHKAALAYRKANAFDFKWKIAPPFPTMSASAFSKRVSLTWYDHNGETGKCYVVERRVDNASSFTPCDTLTCGTDYDVAGTVTFSEPIPGNTKVTYRVKALSYKDKWSIYSRALTFTRDAQADAPVLKGEATGTNSIKITWNAVTGAKGYRIERANAANGPFEVVADNMTSTTYNDNGLQENTTYYYRGYSITTAATDKVSAVIAVTTQQRELPTAVEDIHCAAGDGKVSLTWTHKTGFAYNVTRSDKPDGTYTLVGTVYAGSYTDTAIDNGNAYYYKVQMFKGTDLGPESEAIEAQPARGHFMHFAFNEGKGTTAYDDWGGYNATLYGDSDWTSGQTDGALAFSKDKLSYAKIANNATTDLKDYTVAVWFKPTTNRGTVFTFGGTTYYMSLVAGSANMTFTFKTSKGSVSETFNNIAADNDAWTHVALSQQGSKVLLYVNGNAMGELNMPTVMYPADLGKTTKNYLAHPHSYDEDYCDHVYDDFRVYNYALSATDIAALSQNKEVTGIVSITAQHDTGAVYTLEGRKVCNDISKAKRLPRGIYIVNGRKFIVK